MKTIIGLRWWIIGLVCLGTIVNYLSRNALGVMAPELMKLMHMSTQQTRTWSAPSRSVTPSCSRSAVSSST
ncbi:MAG: Hexuronate transporter [uncultured Paraburkholderia sp.]|nr:MAG: Hexuronate transporter [uncultured Paraburkholderia sp.]